MIKSRLTVIKSQISELEIITDLDNCQKAKIHLLIKEANSKNEDFKTKLDILNNTDPEPPDYDEETVMTTENTISDLFISIQEMVAVKWPSLAENLSIFPSDKSNKSNNNSHLNTSTTS